MKLKIRSGLHCDWITVRLPGAPGAYGFSQLPKEKVFRCNRGSEWRAIEGHYHNTGEVYTLATKSGPECYADPDPLMRFAMCVLPPIITRLDLCMEVEGLPVTPGLAHMFAGQRGGDKGYEESVKDRRFRESKTARTVYVGSRSAPTFLRVYEKESDDGRLMSEWAAHGWTGGDLTRVEYELKRRAVERVWDGAAVPLGAEWERMKRSLWSDSLARLRLCDTMPERHRYACEARTDDRWVMLGEPQKAPPPVVLHGGPDPDILARTIERALKKGLPWAKVEALLDGLAKTWRPR